MHNADQNLSSLAGLSGLLATCGALGTLGSFLGVLGLLARGALGRRLPVGVLRCIAEHGPQRGLEGICVLPQSSDLQADQYWAMTLLQLVLFQECAAAPRYSGPNIPSCQNRSPSLFSKFLMACTRLLRVLI